MRAEHIVGAVVRALIEEILVLGGQLARRNRGRDSGFLRRDGLRSLSHKGKFASFDDTRFEDPFRVRLIRLVRQAFAAPFEDAHGRRIG